MVGIVEAGGAASGIKAMLDILKGLKATSDAAAINEAKIALQSAILEAQSDLMQMQQAQTANLQRIRELEDQIVQLKDWSGEQARYEAVDIYLGTIAYMPKLGMENGEPPHWLCANCFQKHTKSFLAHKGQLTTSTGGRGAESKWGCDTCGATLQVSYRTHPDRTQEKRIAAASQS